MRPTGPIPARAAIRRWLAGLALAGGLLPAPAPARLLDKDPDADPGMLCETVDMAVGRLRLTMGGHAIIVLDEGLECPALPNPILSVPGRGLVTLGSDLGHGRGAWESVRCWRDDTPRGARLTIRGRFLGLAVEQTLQVGRDTVEADCRVTRDAPGPAIAFCTFGPQRFVRAPGGLPFSAQMRDGRTVTGDLNRPFEPLSQVRRLDVRVEGRRLTYDFGDTEGVELRSSGTPPEHPTAAQISIRAVDTPFGKEGGSVGYRWTITLAPDA